MAKSLNYEGVYTIKRNGVMYYRAMKMHNGNTNHNI